MKKYIWLVKNNQGLNGTLTTLTKWSESLGPWDLEVNGQLSQPPEIPEEVTQEKNVEKIMFQQLSCINFWKKIWKKFKYLEETACASYGRRGAPYFLVSFSSIVIKSLIRALFWGAPHLPKRKSAKPLNGNLKHPKMQFSWLNSAPWKQIWAKMSNSYCICQDESIDTP